MATAEKVLSIAKKDTVDIVAEQVRKFQERGELHFPKNYSPENALKSAWLILQNTYTKDKKPVLAACTKASIMNALLDMVIQGLNPAKKQVYFIPYGNVLTCQRSYFGTMAVTKRVTGAKDIYAEVVYEDDEFEYEIKNGNKRVIKHVQSLKNINKDKIVAAYCVIVMPDDRTFTEIMTMDQIRMAWSKSKMNPDDPKSTHSLFTEEMAKKTVINRACKAFINSSMDDSLVIRHFNRADDVAEEAAFQQEVAENANKEFIEADYEMKEEESNGSEEDEDGNTQAEDNSAPKEPEKKARVPKAAAKRGPDF